MKKRNIQTISYSRTAVELVFVAANVTNGDQNQRCVSGVVCPAGDSRRQRNDVSLTDGMDALVLIYLLAAPSAVSLESFRATRNHNSTNALA